jgi:hypothetical protein
VREKRWSRKFTSLSQRNRQRCGNRTTGSTVHKKILRRHRNKAAGAYADIVAVSGDPLRDVGELEQVDFVIHNGAVFKDEMKK